MNDKKIKIGLALGGGGALGIAHVGVLEVLEEYGIKVDLIAGTSMGAIIGGAYAAGVPVSKIKEECMGIKTINLFDINLKMGSLFTGNSAEKIIREAIKVEYFSKTKIPFACTACNLYTGEQIAINEGNLIKGIRASMSAPAIFRPVEYKDMLLIDGGLKGNIPVDVVKKMGADIIIGVNVLGDYNIDKKPLTMTSTIVDCLFMQQDYITKAKIKEVKPDFIINLNLGIDRQQEFSKKHTQECIKVGREKTKRMMPKILDKIKSLTSESDSDSM